MNTEQPAFPTWVRNDDMTPGMTLRDFFAAQIITRHERWDDDYAMAKYAYQVADAMLKAREQ